MGKFTLIIIGIYLFYYIGNIIYDLYIRKDKVVEIDEITEYAMKDFSSQVEEKIQNTTIDDVENMNIPSGLDNNSYQEELFNEPSQQEQEENISKLQRKYEEELEVNTDFEYKAENNSPIKTAINSVLDNWDNFINEMETSVMITGNINGHKTYNIK